MSTNWSPPSSPDPHGNPIIPTDDSGMVTDPLKSSTEPSKYEVTPARKKRRTLQYVSRHFSPSQSRMSKPMKDGQRKSKRRKLAQDKENEPQEIVQVEAEEQDSVIEDDQQHSTQKSQIQKYPSEQRVEESTQNPAEQKDASEVWQSVIAAAPEQQSRVFFGLLVDDLSSDSDLTDVPDDIGPDPFTDDVTSTKRKKGSAKKKRTPRSKPAAAKESSPEKKTPKPTLTKSPYFPHAHKPRPTFLSTLPFPPLDLERFGLMQERLCHDPYRLLLATIFLNKTPGNRAMPIFYKLMEKYPTPKDLAQAEQADVTEIIRELGFQNQRARKVIAMSAKWVEQPPRKGIRFRKPDYPKKGDGKDIRADETVDDTDERVAWEISHLPGLGPYSHDSWRMFCRDELRGLASSYNGEDARRSDDHGDENEMFEPEWKRVLPTDKELRAWMTWMWMKEGYVWNKETGTKTKASEELMDLARGRGNIVLEDSEKSTLVVKSLEDDQPADLKLPEKERKSVKVETPAGEYVPDSRRKS